MTKLTEEEAQEMLKQLSAHYRQPVMPVSKYCESMYTWEKCIHDRYHRLMMELFPGMDMKNDQETQQATYDLYKKEMADTSTAAPERRWKLEELKSHRTYSDQVSDVS